MQLGQIRQSSALHPGKILLLFIIYGLLWFGTLNYRHLIPSDEGRYAEIAREMLVTGDWVTPRYNGYKFGQLQQHFKYLALVIGKHVYGLHLLAS